MMDENRGGSFEQLPQSLVDELLDNTPRISESLSNDYKEMQKERKNLREELSDQIEKDRDIGRPVIPTSAGIDGSYTIERLLSTDISAYAAVAIEGLVPPSEERFWPKPQHFSGMNPVKHSDDTSVVVRALMIGHELILASRAPHDLIMLDGSLTTPFIYLNQAMNKLESVDEELKNELLNATEDILTAYKEVLEAERSDKVFVGVPKYTSKSEVSKKLGFEDEYEDRALLNHILETGEVIRNIKIEEPDSEWHVNLNRHSKNEEMEEIRDEYIIPNLKRIKVIYYRPQSWMPVLRLEVPESVASNKNRTATLLKGIEHQCRTPSIMEPYPLYIADRMVKHLSRAIPSVRQAITQNMAFSIEEEIEDIYMAMHSYRTEGGY